MRHACGAPLPADVERLPGVEQAGSFRFRRVSDRVLLTNEEGDHALLAPAEFDAFLAGTLDARSPLAADLRAKGFLAGGRGEEEAAALLARRKAFLGVGPYLHVLVTTLRCNQACVYCHASRTGMSAPGSDMSPEIADRAVDLAFESPSPQVTLEFQGGEPLANFPVVKRVVERAQERNRDARKVLQFSLVSNLSLMDEEKLAFVLDHGIQVCTSLDGPADLHDANRPFAGASSHAETVRWMERINEGYRGRGLDPELYHVEALLTVTRASLSRGRDILDEYVRRGLRAIFVRPLNPFGFAQRTWRQIGYGTDEFLRFHREVLDEVLRRNAEGTQLVERLATIFLAKILTGSDPNYLDIRSPCGAGIGQIAYNHDGQVFCCDEGRMLHQMGDSLFRIGDARTDRYVDLVESDVVRSVCVASCLEAQPVCCDCAYLPYCGACPVFNYATQGSIFGRAADNERCRLHMGVLDDLFGRLGRGDRELGDVLRRWVEPRPRPYFTHQA
jgi:His-Xaa-Ser system radical SAM maturase HxsB